METPHIRHALAGLGYIAATFCVQATSHFVVNRGHYAGIPHLRAEPVFPLGIGSMIVQAASLTFLYAADLDPVRRSMRSALVFAWLAGSVLMSYMALGEAAKYRVPSIASWIAVELAAGFAQFSLYGLVLGAVYRPRR